ncbi:hypothetical protein N8I77_007144 [Diaporthe amygdali]|uniref:AAA+ ATPase domain-containing protein n=1 Tax=Phomopsis amygdali TaxID=1214568 RepID=A0AAD9SDU0_PHOAM|nr:hypothetical protein N8I77_007144 [Diaporthe amygdali]
MNSESDGRSRFSWSRFKSRAKKRRKRRRQLKNAKGSGDSGAAKGGTDVDDESARKPQEIIPELRYCNFEQFQSRPAAAGNDQKLPCVDVLIADDSLDDEVRDFSKLIEKMKAGTVKSWTPSRAATLPEDATPDDSTKKWIRRIRINSQAVMELVNHVCFEDDELTSQPMVFFRPFQVLVFRYKDMQEQLTRIQKLASEGDWESKVKKLREEKGALDELQCFLGFMESRIMPDSRRYRDSLSPPPRTIRYEDLWYLFKPGDLVYVSRDMWKHQNSRRRMPSQQILRVVETHLTTTSLQMSPQGFTLENPWSLICHFYEYDGTTYMPQSLIFDPFLPFRGKKRVTELMLYPVSYLEDDKIMAQAQTSGQTYVDLIERRSGFYSGWTETLNPRGQPLTDDEILVDYQETFNAFPTWRVLPYPGIGGDQLTRTGFYLFESEDQPLVELDEVGGATYEKFDQCLARDMTEFTESRTFVEKDLFVRFSRDSTAAPSGHILALLPRRFFAYAVLERRFLQLNTRFVRNADLETNDKAFEKLEINPKYKRLILALVKSHFDKIETEKRTNVEIETQDLIRGKGKGVVILLHGVPGVGKTATAEAVALKWKKPLFPITCGDLGYTAEKLERSLHDIFRLAHHWGCILLLDEADVFITQRERHDLKRNALVSAFLRVLEYYNGIIFLTTNRAGVLDEAIKSRVHLNLHYGHLDEEQTVAIFKQHILRLRDIEKQRNTDKSEQIVVLHQEIIQFARDHFNKRDNKHGPGSNFGRWNGRQIRNAFFIASSLAHYDNADEGNDKTNDELADRSVKVQKQLGRKHFELVAETTLLYDQFREAVHSGKSDDHVALEREERASPSQNRARTPDRFKTPR